jgi:hypothetical protein
LTADRPISESLGVLTSERQHLVTQSQAERLRRALASFDQKGTHAKAAKAIREGLQSKLGDLAELAEYEARCGPFPRATTVIDPTK